MLIFFFVRNFERYIYNVVRIPLRNLLTIYQSRKSNASLKNFFKFRKISKNGILEMERQTEGWRKRDGEVQYQYGERASILQTVLIYNFCWKNDSLPRDESSMKNTEATSNGHFLVKISSRLEIAFRRISRDDDGSGEDGSVEQFFIPQTTWRIMITPWWWVFRG